VVLFDGTDVKPGGPTDSLATLRLSAAEAGRPVTALFISSGSARARGRRPKTDLRSRN
jgi:hypothetical protein